MALITVTAYSLRTSIYEPSLINADNIVNSTIVHCKDNQNRTILLLSSGDYIAVAENVVQIQQLAEEANRRSRSGESFEEKLSRSLSWGKGESRHGN